MRLRQSLARVLLEQGPAAARRRATAGADGVPATTATSWGTLVHLATLGGSDRIVRVDADDWRSKGARDSRVEASAAGRVAMLSRDWDRVAAASTAATTMLLRATRELGVAAPAATETSLEWISHGCPCAGTLDWMAHQDGRGVILDLKTTDSDPSAFAASVWRYGYDIQAAAYLDAARTLHPHIRWTYGLVVVPEEPEDTWWAPLSPAYLEVGERRWREAKRVWARCLQDGSWPGPVSGVAIEPPAWVLSKSEDYNG